MATPGFSMLPVELSEDFRLRMRVDEELWKGTKKKDVDNGDQKTQHTFYRKTFAFPTKRLFPESETKIEDNFPDKI